MLQTIGQVREWVLDKIEIHEMSITNTSPFSLIESAHHGAVAAYKMLLEALEGSQQTDTSVDLKDPAVIEGLRKCLGGPVHDPESTYDNDADVADDPRR